MHPGTPGKLLGVLGDIPSEDSTLGRGKIFYKIIRCYKSYGVISSKAADIVVHQQVNKIK